MTEVLAITAALAGVAAAGLMWLENRSVWRAYREQVAAWAQERAVLIDRVQYPQGAVVRAMADLDDLIVHKPRPLDEDDRPGAPAPRVAGPAGFPPELVDDILPPPVEGPV